MMANERFFSKHLILVQDSDTKESLTNFFKHSIIFNDLPLTMVISLMNDKTIDFWYRHGHEKEGERYNQFLIDSRTFLYEEKPFFPKIDDLTGVELKVATINYPPYTFYEFVVSCFFHDVI